MKLHRYIDHDWQMTPIDFQPKRHKHNPRLRHGQIISTQRPSRVFRRRIAVALGIDPHNDAESVLTSRTFAELHYIAQFPVMQELREPI
ncbi:hypothetical protein DPMN_018717, partial [Dreissena polymorpha]